MAGRDTAGELMTHILRLTRHKAEDVQITELQKAFGEVEIEEVSETLPTIAREAVARFDELAAEAEVAEVVLPINLMESILKFSEFSKRGGTLLRSVMDRNVKVDGQAIFTFNHYEVIDKVEVVSHPLNEG